MSKENEIDEGAQLAKKRYDASSEYCKPYFDRFMDNYKHYFLRVIDEAVEADPESYPFYSQSMLPISYQIVETLQPRMFSRLPSFGIKTEEVNDERSEKYLENLIKYQLQHPYLIDDPIYSRLAVASKELFITGNAWGAVPWKMKEAEVEEWQPYSVQLGITEPSWDNMEKIMYYKVKPQWALVKVTKRVIDAPVFEHKNVFHVLPDPKKKRVSDLGWAILDEKMTPEELMDMINMSPRDYQNVEQLKKMITDKEWGTSGKDSYDDQLAGIFNSTDHSYKTDNTDEGQLKVWITLEKDKISVVVNEKLTIRQSGNPNGDNKLGLFLMKDIPVPHELFAWGEPDPIKRIEDAMTDQSNMRSDSVFYDLLRMWKLKPDSLVDGEEFIPEPGNIIQMKDMDGLQPMEKGSTDPTAYKEYTEWEKVIQSTTGVSDYVRGSVDPSMTKTMGGIDLLQQAANARFNMKLQLFENLGLKAMGSMYVQRDMRYFDTAQMIEVDGIKTKIEPDMIRQIRGNIHFIVESGSTEATNKAQEFNKWKMLMSLYGKPPFDNLAPEAADAWAKRLMYALEETDVDTLLKRNPVSDTNKVDLNNAVSKGVATANAQVNAAAGVNPPQVTPPTGQVQPENAESNQEITTETSPTQ